MVMSIIIRIGIVEFVPKENSNNNSVDSFDEYPDLNIYEKIQMLQYENLFEEIDWRLYLPKDEEKINKSIPIPTKKLQ